MTIRNSAFAIAAAFAAVTASGAVSTASAGDRDVFIQDYKFKKPLHGYSGHSGNFYCDYQRLPDRKCVVVGGVERCKIVGWTLREMCH